MKLDYTFYKVGLDPDGNNIVSKPVDMVVLTKESFIWLVDRIPFFDLDEESRDVINDINATVAALDNDLER